MAESLITISVIGLVAGFVFSMPTAGPISILITSNALKGKLKYCNLLALGSSVADFIYVLIAVYGITHLFNEYKGLIPYILGAGSFFIIYIGIKVIRHKFDTGHIEEDSHLVELRTKAGKGGFYTGFMVNLLNPTLFFGWLASSFIIISFAASLGFDTGGLNTTLNNNITQIENIEGGKLSEKPQMPGYLQFDTLNILRHENRKPVSLAAPPKHFHLLVSICYSFFLAAGSVIWFVLLTLVLYEFRKKINITILNYVIQSLGVILCLLGVFFAYTAVKMLIT